MRKKVVICAFFLFSMTLFCAEEFPAEREEVNRYEERRNRLIKEVKDQHPDVSDGVIVLFASFDPDLSEFQQERHFYYLTGVKEPGTVLLLNFSGESVLYVPGGLEKRMQWTPVRAELVKKDAKELGFNEILELESTAPGPLFLENEYLNLRQRFNEVIQNSGKIFTLHSTVNRPILPDQRLMLHQLNKFVPDFLDHVEDISSTIFIMRQVKDESEIACLIKAVDFTVKAHNAIVKEAIEPGRTECFVRAVADGAMLAKNSRPGFSSIIGSGENTTVLHCPAGDRVMKDGDLLIADIGAECPCDGYSADLTRTYPVSGKFTEEQREIYSIVWGALKHVTKSVRPGFYFTKSVEDKKKSLPIIAKEYFEQRNCGQFFTHGIGHHIGLSTHEDCSDNSKTWLCVPLRRNNVVAIEPGLYLTKKALEERYGRKFEEGFGVRIESNYLVTEDSPICLDEALPKDPNAIENLMQKLRE